GCERDECVAWARYRIAYFASPDVHGEDVALDETELGIDVDGERIAAGLVGLRLVIDAECVDRLAVALFLQRSLIGRHRRLPLFKPQLAMRRRLHHADIRG